MLSLSDERFEVNDEQDRAHDERGDEVLVNGDTTTLQHPVCVKQSQAATSLSAKTPKCRKCTTELLMLIIIIIIITVNLYSAFLLEKPQTR